MDVERTVFAGRHSNIANVPYVKECKTSCESITFLLDKPFLNNDIRREMSSHSFYTLILCLSENCFS
jgi:hypothetical protein